MGWGMRGGMIWDSQPQGLINHSPSGEADVSFGDFLSAWRAGQLSAALLNSCPVTSFPLKAGTSRSFLDESTSVINREFQMKQIYSIYHRNMPA